MTNIQVLFFCGLFAVMIAAQFFILWRQYRMNRRMDKLAENDEKFKELSNKIYEKLKEVVDAVNPLLAKEQSVNKDNDVIDVVPEEVFVEEESAVI